MSELDTAREEVVYYPDPSRPEGFGTWRRKDSTPRPGSPWQVIFSPAGTAGDGPPPLDEVWLYLWRRLVVLAHALWGWWLLSRGMGAEAVWRWVDPEDHYRAYPVGTRVPGGSGAALAAATARLLVASPPVESRLPRLLRQPSAEGSRSIDHLVRAYERGEMDSVPPLLDLLLEGGIIDHCELTIPSRPRRDWRKVCRHSVGQLAEVGVLPRRRVRTRWTAMQELEDALLALDVDSVGPASSRHLDDKELGAAIRALFRRLRLPHLSVAFDPRHRGTCVSCEFCGLHGAEQLYPLLRRAFPHNQEVDDPELWDEDEDGDRPPVLSDGTPRPRGVYWLREF